MSEFDKLMTEHQVAWRQKHVTGKREGTQNGKQRPWILLAELWEEGLWPGIRCGSRRPLQAYLNGNRIEKHKGVHNLKSSWVLCANLYFPFGAEHGRSLLAGFLKQYVSPMIEVVEAVELEWEAQEESLRPQALLGEPAGGQRGANQTSPDVAFVVRTHGGKGLVLTENKLVEHCFYPCSGRKSEVCNPDGARCMDAAALIANPAGRCWQCRWETDTRKNRKYWDHIRLSDQAGRMLTRCPAATDGYQLFRQQALAEGIAASNRYELVVSCVAYDARNGALMGCLRGTGIDDFTTGWGTLFDGKARFATFTHQQWVAWVRQHDQDCQWVDWCRYVGERYGY